MGLPLFKISREWKSIDPFPELDPFGSEESSLFSMNFGDGDVAEYLNAEITQKNDERLAPEFTALIQESNVNDEKKGIIWQPTNSKNFEELCKSMSLFSEFGPSRREESSLLNMNFGDGDVAEYLNAKITEKNEEQLAPKNTALIQESNVNDEKNGTKWQPRNLKNLEVEYESMSPFSEFGPSRREESSLSHIIDKYSNAEIIEKNGEQLSQTSIAPIQKSDFKVEKHGTTPQYPDEKNSEDDKNGDIAEYSHAEITQKNDEQLPQTFTPPFQESNIKFELAGTTSQSPSVKNTEDEKKNEKTEKKLGKKRNNSGHNKYSKDNTIQKIKTNIMEYKIINRLNRSLKNKGCKFYRLHKALSENLKKSFNQKLLETTIRDLFYYINISDKCRTSIKPLSNRNLIDTIEAEQVETETLKILNMTYHDIINKVREEELDDFLNYIKSREKQNEDNDEYMKSLKELLNNFKKWFDDKEGRKSKKKKEKGKEEKEKEKEKGKEEKENGKEKKEKEKGKKPIYIDKKILEDLFIIQKKNELI